MPEANLTERQQKWFATMRAGLERDTGKSMAEWVAIARTCPEAGHRARLRGLKDRLPGDLRATPHPSASPPPSPARGEGTR